MLDPVFGTARHFSLFKLRSTVLESSRRWIGTVELPWDSGRREVWFRVGFGQLSCRYALEQRLKFAVNHGWLWLLLCGRFAWLVCRDTIILRHDVVRLITIKCDLQIYSQFLETKLCHISTNTKI